MKEILVCMTFREFDGGRNAKIQSTVLKSIENQTYKNFRLIVTNYREEKVKKELEKYNFKFEFHQSKLIEHSEYRLSWSEIIINCFQHLEPNKNIILWTQADCIFENNFFEEIINNFSEGVSGTSWPEFQYASLDDYYLKKTISNRDIIHDKSSNRYNDITKYLPRKSFFHFDAGLWVPDLLYLDGDIFLDSQNVKKFKKYLIRGAWPGQAQTIMFGFLGKKRINLIFKSKVHEIQNVRDEDLLLINKHGFTGTEAEKEWYKKDSRIMIEESYSIKQYLKYLKENSIEKKYWPSRFSKLYQHFEFEVIGTAGEKLKFKLYFLFWTTYHIITYSYNRLIYFLSHPFNKKLKVIKNKIF